MSDFQLKIRSKAMLKSHLSIWAIFFFHLDDKETNKNLLFIKSCKIIALSMKYSSKEVTMTDGINLFSHKMRRPLHCVITEGLWCETGLTASLYLIESPVVLSPAVQIHIDPYFIQKYFQHKKKNTQKIIRNTYYIPFSLFLSKWQGNTYQTLLKWCKEKYG